MRRVRVLQSLEAPDGTTKFSTQMRDGSPDDVEQIFFSWRRAIVGGYDVFHVHWPELLVRAGTRPRRAVKQTLLVLFVLRMTICRVPVVRTVHNESPHEAGRGVEQLALKLLERRTCTYVVLNPFTAVPDGAVTELVPHSHYVGRFPLADADPVDGRLLTCGLLRPYKGVEDLLRVVATMSKQPLSVHVVGKPLNTEFAATLQMAASLDPRVELTLSFVPDEQLAQEMAASQLVVLPYHRMHNSGMLMLALSLGRPVVAPRNEVTEWIASEVGQEWLTLFDGAVGTDVLEGALDRAPQVIASGRPHFDGRSWEESGQRYAAVYRRLVR